MLNLHQDRSQKQSQDGQQNDEDFERAVQEEMVRMDKMIQQMILMQHDPIPLLTTSDSTSHLYPDGPATSSKLSSNEMLISASLHDNFQSAKSVKNNAVSQYESIHSQQYVNQHPVNNNGYSPHSESSQNKRQAEEPELAAGDNYPQLTQPGMPNQLIRLRKQSAALEQKAALDSQIEANNRRKKAEKDRDREDYEKLELRMRQEALRLEEEMRQTREVQRQKESKMLINQQSKSEQDALRRRGKSAAVIGSISSESSQLESLQSHLPTQINDQTQNRQNCTLVPSHLPHSAIGQPLAQFKTLSNVSPPPQTSSSPKTLTIARMQMLKDVYGSMGYSLGTGIGTGVSITPPSFNREEYGRRKQSLNNISLDAEFKVPSAVSSEFHNLQCPSQHLTQHPITSSTISINNNSGSNNHSHISPKQFAAERKRLAIIEQKAALDAQIEENSRRKKAEKDREKEYDEKLEWHMRQEAARLEEEKYQAREAQRRGESNMMTNQQSKSEQDALRRRGKASTLRNSNQRVGSEIIMPSSRIGVESTQLRFHDASAHPEIAPQNTPYESGSPAEHKEKLHLTSKAQSNNIGYSSYTSNRDSGDNIDLDSSECDIVQLMTVESRLLTAGSWQAHLQKASDDFYNIQNSGSDTIEISTQSQSQPQPTRCHDSHGYLTMDGPSIRIKNYSSYSNPSYYNSASTYSSSSCGHYTTNGTAQKHGVAMPQKANSNRVSLEVEDSVMERSLASESLLLFVPPQPVRDTNYNVGQVASRPNSAVKLTNVMEPIVENANLARFDTASLSSSLGSIYEPVSAVPANSATSAPIIRNNSAMINNEDERHIIAAAPLRGTNRVASSLPKVRKIINDVQKSKSLIESGRETTRSSRGVSSKPIENFVQVRTGGRALQASNKLQAQTRHAVGDNNVHSISNPNSLTNSLSSSISHISLLQRGKDTVTNNALGSNNNISQARTVNSHVVETFANRSNTIVNPAVNAVGMQSSCKSTNAANEQRLHFPYSIEAEDFSSNPKNTQVVEVVDDDDDDELEVLIVPLYETNLSNARNNPNTDQSRSQLLESISYGLSSSVSNDSIHQSRPLSSESVFHGIATSDNKFPRISLQSAPPLELAFATQSSPTTAIQSVGSLKVLETEMQSDSFKSILCQLEAEAATGPQNQQAPKNASVLE